MITLTLAKQAELKQILQLHGGMLPVQQVQSSLSELACTIDQFMYALLPLAAEFAVVPISNYRATVVGLGETGNIYIGANQEFTRIELCQAVHAEQALIVAAHQHGETGMVKIAISANPCGHCRQFLFELAEGGKLEILVQGEVPGKLSSLLPHAFGPKDLQVKGGLLTPQQHVLQFVNHADEKLMLLALQAAAKSYAPYTKAYTGVALRTRDGRTFTGSYLENAAFNPSLPAIQSALTSLILSGCRYEDVAEAVLVQMKDNAVDQAAVARLILQVICPNVVLRTAELLNKTL